MVVTHDTVFEVTLVLRNIHGVADVDNVGLLTILGSIIACLYFMFGVESRSQQFLYLTAMTYGINDVHFIFSALLSEADSTFLPSSIYFVVYQLTASFCYIINAIVIMQTYNSPGDCIFGGYGRNAYQLNDDEECLSGYDVRQRQPDMLWNVSEAFCLFILIVSGSLHLPASDIKCQGRNTKKRKGMAFKYQVCFLKDFLRLAWSRSVTRVAQIHKFKERPNVYDQITEFLWNIIRDTLFR
ncbi:hypothetical protein HPB51_025523 [Rhipicephalus microplus]|uniref:Uncharacterized protein n=1 Tax=Rhipicephalus microplus TaxID=6941 RepID=A0A9J6DE40_RHIMP|nr:hypothetical protein HPB51_025523 [Rhipicephalus microplus]